MQAHREPGGLLALIEKLLKPGRQVVIIDFHERELPVGSRAAMKIAREDLLKQIQGARVATPSDRRPRNLLFAVIGRVVLYPLYRLASAKCFRTLRERYAPNPPGYVAARVALATIDVEEVFVTHSGDAVVSLRPSAGILLDPKITDH